ncbi:MAG: hypothetical protein ACOZQL_22890 [Myxococcota bacterium]
MTALFHAHSGLRFLVLLLGVLNLAALIFSLTSKGKFAKHHRILHSAFTGTLHLQVLLGVGLVAMGRYYPALIGHMVMMLIATVVSQVSAAVNKKKPEPGLVLPLIGVSAALLLIFGGVMAIGRGLFTMTPGT